MSDASQYDRSQLLHTAKPAPPRQPKPGEFLFEFYRESDHSRWLCELRDHGKDYGVEAQFFKNEELDRARRFDPRLDVSRPSRELAIAWAEEERKHIEAYQAQPPREASRGLLSPCPSPSPTDDTGNGRCAPK